MSEENLLKNISSLFEGNNLIGDDCAIIPLSEITHSPSNESLLVSTDTLVENVHFSLDYFSFEDIGYKAIAVNLSDIAASSGIPLFISVSMAIPKRISEDNILSIYKGMKILCDKYKVKLSGGDIVRSNELTVTITIIGKAKKTLKRKTSNEDDFIYISGYLGLASYGLSLFKKRIKDGSNSALKHLRPYPRLDLIHHLTEKYNITSCIDISDGLSTDLTRLLPDNLCAEIYFDKIPFHDEIKDLKLLELKEHILNGGEDFELLFTSPDDINLEEVSKIGKVIKADKNVLIFDNHKESFVSKGYDHLN